MRAPAAAAAVGGRARVLARFLLLLLLLPHLPATCAAAAACPGNSSEAAALLDFRAGLLSAEKLADWGSDSAAPWTGVVCDAGGQVSSLDLYVKHLAGPIAWEPLARLSSLRALKLGSNALSGTLSSTLPPRLEQLSLADNRLTSELPDNWALPRTLRALDVSMNWIYGTLSPAWQLPPGLEELQLANNELAGNLPAGWALPASLHYLSVQNNSLTGTLPHWPDLASLEVRATPQTVGGFCGEVPASPKYMYRDGATWAPVTSLPSCAAESPGPPAPAAFPSPPTPLPPIIGGLVPLPTPKSPPSEEGLGGTPTGTGPADGELPPPAASPDVGMSPEAPVAPGAPGGELVPPAEPAGNQTEVDALLMFRSALASSAALEDWSGRLPSACGWTGVVCGPSGHVTQLNLNVRRLLGSIPWEELSLLSQLQKLDLSSNMLSGTLGGWALPSSLQSLVLGDNLLAGTVPANLTLPPNLTDFDASGNALSGTLPPLPLLLSLRTLRLVSNSLAGSIPQGWNISSSIQDIFLYNNTLTGSLPSWPTLRELDMHVEPQRGPGFCGQLPAAPRYLGGFDGGPKYEINGSALPPCDGALALPISDNLSTTAPAPAPSLPPGAAAAAPSSLDQLKPVATGGGSSTGAIVGAVVGAACGAAVLAGLGWWCHRRRKRKLQPPKLTPGQGAHPQEAVDLDLEKGKPEPLPESPDATDCPSYFPRKLQSSEDSARTGSVDAPGRRSGIETPNPSSSGRAATLSNSSAEAGRLSASDSLPLPSPVSAQAEVCHADSLPLSTLSRRTSSSASSIDVRPWLFEYKDFEILHPIGEGSYSRVYLAKWRETIVAVKVFLVKAHDNEPSAPAAQLSLSHPVLDNLRRESTLLATLRHPNIVGFLGVCTSPPCLVQEYCQRGSMAQVLERAAATPNPAAALGWPRRLQMLLDAAKGMAYLHLFTPPVVHRDLKTPNLLVDRHWTVKVSDFNLSKLAAPEQSAAKSSQVVNNPRWLAPEILDGGPSTPASDVYAFGVCMFEAATMRLPWGDMTTWQIVNAATSGRRPEVPEDPSELPGGGFGGLPAYLDLMRRCWAQDPAERPPFSQITVQLRQLLLEVTGAAQGLPSRQGSVGTESSVPQGTAGRQGAAEAD